MKKTPENDAIRLKHMLDAARKVQVFMTSKTKNDLENDDMLVFAVVRALEIIGEAANQITDVTQQTHSHIAWKDIVGMRNVIVHAYFDVDIDIVWRTIQDDLPLIIEQVETVLNTDEENHND
jgi:uncharacterized protein with HEPN domain